MKVMVNGMIVYILCLGFAGSLQGVPYKLGIENISDQLLQELQKKRIGLITNQTGRDQKGQRTIDVLRQRGLRIVKIMVPEHGLNGDIPAEKPVSNSFDKKTKIPVISLYGKGMGKKIDETILDDVDIIIFELQDSGMRHYTYISTLLTVLEAAALYGKQVIVFDRPNPLGYIMEGPLVESDLFSFVSIAAIPLRHGMTIGELARFFNEQVLKKTARLSIVWMDNYDRRMGLAGLWLANLSPNISNIQACYGYSFLGLLGEVEPFKNGVLMGRPFQLVALPEKNAFSDQQWRSLALLLKGYGIGTQEMRLKKNWKIYKGLLITIKDINMVSGFQTLLAVLDYAKQEQLPMTFRPIFDKAVGTKKLRAYLNDSLSRSKLIASINNDLIDFFKRAESYYFYKPTPRPLLIR